MNMNIDRGTLENLLKLDDDTLWQAINAIASESGIDISKTRLRRRDLPRLRRRVAGATDDDIAEALRNLEKYKTENGGVK